MNDFNNFVIATLCFNSAFLNDSKNYVLYSLIKAALRAVINWTNTGIARVNNATINNFCYNVNKDSINQSKHNWNTVITVF